jgi:hypothetical protein
MNRDRHDRDNLNIIIIDGAGGWILPIPPHPIEIIVELMW